MKAGIETSTWASARASAGTPASPKNAGQSSAGQSRRSSFTGILW